MPMFEALWPRKSITVGLDLASVQDVAESIATHGGNYLDRVYTPEEVEDARMSGPLAEGLAARFAAKEATIKALRPESGTTDWREIRVVRSPGGACDIELSGSVAVLARMRGVRSLAVSLTHEADVAAAVVVAHCRAPWRHSQRK